MLEDNLEKSCAETNNDARLRRRRLPLLRRERHSLEYTDSH